MTGIWPTTLPGIDIKVKKTVLYATEVQTAASGKELRATFWSTPRYEFEMTLTFLRQANFSVQTSTDEAATLVAFFGGMQGQFNPFYFTDPYNSTAATVTFGVGTGLSGQTSQLCDSLGVAVVPNSTPSIYVNGVLKTVGTDYTISATGLVTWINQPGNGAALTWSGTFYYTVRGEQDNLDLERIVNLAWKGGSLKLLTVK